MPAANPHSEHMSPHWTPLNSEDHYSKVIGQNRVPVSHGAGQKGVVDLREFGDEMHKATMTQKAFDGVWVTLVNSHHSANRAVSCLR
ncbi:hypothetical protein OKW43_001546 [Paraburkholderia sp. WC7.3g]